MEYKIPEQFYFRIHHARPRFKNDVENVLIYVAENIAKLTPMSEADFAQRLNQAIYGYPGNAHKELKTINNWRTEISSLFGFVQHNDNDIAEAGRRAKELAEDGDLVAFFKTYLYSFQYPGAHIKSHAILEQIEHGIHFKPAQYILKLLTHIKEVEGANIGLTKGEICHCVFNDLRVTRDGEDVSLAWERIKTNRKSKLTYDMTGDVIRYAGDIVDYMEIANLLKTWDSRTYYLNDLETETIVKFIESKEWFPGYDRMIAKRQGSLDAINSVYYDWFAYVNRDMVITDFKTDILAYIASDQQEYEALKNTGKEITDRIEREEEFTTKDIGDMGENLVHGHECMRIKIGGREDLIHLIKRIPTQFAVGYDISSVELDERKRYIEVKTTISSKPLHFNSIHLTRNEWNTASTTRDAYYVYRLMISKGVTKLFLLQDPVGLYKQDKINMIPNDGADITFDPKTVGRFEDLLVWKH